jgi:uncharacterized damage-inducible protein DinB
VSIGGQTAGDRGRTRSDCVVGREAMIDSGYVQRMAHYNQWQNDNLFGAADGLSDAERRRDRGAFFGSIHATLNHLLWADRIWMSRLAGTPRPAGGIAQSVCLHDDWRDLKRERSAFDAVMLDWANRLDPSALTGELTWYSDAMKAELHRPKWLLVAHMFNHQTHHRGQVHCMLTQAGCKPGDTDLPFAPT